MNIARKFGRSIFPASLLLALLAPYGASAQLDRGASLPAPLACGVDWKPGSGPFDPDRFCLELGAALGRPIVRVDDARTVRLGESVQVFSTAAQWLVAALKDGKVQAWMSVSKLVGKGHEVFVIAGALSAMAAIEVSPDAPCVRVQPKTKRTAATDLLYPWEELKKCKPHETDVADPWARGPALARSKR